MFPHDVDLLIFLFLSIFFNFFGFELPFLSLVKFLNSLFFMFKFIFKEFNLFLELFDLGSEVFFFFEESREFMIKFLSEVLESMVGDECLVGEGKISSGTFVAVFEPLSNGISFIGMPIGSNDWVFNDSVTDGTGPLFLEAQDEAVILWVHG